MGTCPCQDPENSTYKKQIGVKLSEVVRYRITSNDRSIATVILMTKNIFQAVNPIMSYQDNKK